LLAFLRTTDQAISKTNQETIDYDQAMGRLISDLAQKHDSRFIHRPPNAPLIVNITLDQLILTELVTHFFQYKRAIIFNVVAKLKLSNACRKQLFSFMNDLIDKNSVKNNLRHTFHSLSRHCDSLFSE
jgi:hypothetical protein